MRTAKLAARIVLPCRNCRNPACELELPALEGPAAMLLKPILTIAAARLGVKFTASNSENPLEAIPPAALSEILGVVCPGCIEVRCVA